VGLDKATEGKGQIRSSVACNLDRHILAAAWPLFQSGNIQAIEWSFDALFQVEQIPAWFFDLIHAFSEKGRLIGHGVFFSLFSGRWMKDQQAWLDQLKIYSTQFDFDHISEHFGFMTGSNFHKGAPLSIPYNNTTLAIGRDRLHRISEVCECPVGLENLAFAYSMDEIDRHGDFLQKLIEPVNGFIILDLHNLYCQMQNFDRSFEDILKLYPLDRVREIHISGGSWEDSKIYATRKIRRDTHDQAVPVVVFELLHQLIPKCPQLKYVILEQIGPSLSTIESQAQFRDDFIKMDHIVRRHERNTRHESNNFKPIKHHAPGLPLENEELYTQQKALSNILESAVDYHHASVLLNQSALVNTDWNVENWPPHMLETAIAIAQKWK
jgi:uncharacterized protein (UPF0276 family)